MAGAGPLSGGLKATLDELIERTAHTATMEPTSIISKTQMSLIETSIEGRTEIKFKYRSQTAKKSSVRAVRPLGLLYGVLVICALVRRPEALLSIVWTY